MKKKRMLLFIPMALVLILAGAAWYTWVNALPFVQIEPTAWAATCPAEPGAVIVGITGGVPLPVDAPPPKPNTSGYQATVVALSTTKYIPLPSWLRPKDGGIMVEVPSGCIGNEPIYWADGVLWVAMEDETWRPYLPLDGKELDTALRGLADDYGYPYKDGLELKWEDAMKQKLTLFASALFVAVLAAGIFFLLYIHLEHYNFQDIRHGSKGYAVQASPQPERRLSLVQTGDYPGMSDEPVSWEGGQLHRETMRVLNAQTYYPRPIFWRPGEGGILIGAVEGCSWEVVAYWDGDILWIPTWNDKWIGYMPASPEEMDTKLNTIYNSDWK